MSTSETWVDSPDRQVLDVLLITEQGPDPRFDRIVRLAANRFDTPIARLSFVDGDQIWYKASIGMDAEPRPRDQSICDHTVRANTPLIASDVWNDPRFSALMQRTGGRLPRFYAGAPLVLDDGQRVGSLCLLDRVPRPDFTEDHGRELMDFAEIAVHELQLHRHIVDSSHALERAESDARNAHEARQRFLAIMSHELRTPLNAITGLGDMMQEERFGPLGNDRYRAFSRTICDAACRLERLIGRVLTLASATEGRLELRESTIDLARLIDDCTSAAGIEATIKGVSVTTRHVPGTPAGLYGDEVQIVEMIHQLVTNAVNASGEGQTVTVSVQQSTEGVELLVDDLGAGFPRDQSDWLMDPFTMADDGASRSGGGMGLGLPLTRKLAELHGAKLDFPRQEQGFRARIRFPQARSRGVEDLDRARLNC